MKQEMPAGPPARHLNDGKQGLSALEARGLQCRLGERLILAPCNLAIESGVTAVLGPNGSGKSSLLRALARLDMKPMHVDGVILFRGAPLSSLSQAQRAAAMAWLGQGAASDPEQLETSGLNVEGLVRMASLARHGWWRRDQAADRQRAQQAMDEFDLLPLAAAPLAKVSGGELQRAHLARVFAVDSPVLLLDEPDNHLDLRHQSRLKELMQARASRQDAVVFSTHDLNAAMNADRLLVLQQGRLMLDTRLADISDQALSSMLGDVFDSPLSLIRHEGRRVFVQH